MYVHPTEGIHPSCKFTTRTRTNELIRVSQSKMSNEGDIKFISCTGEVLSITVSKNKLKLLLVQNFAAQVYMRMFNCAYLKSKI